MLVINLSVNVTGVFVSFQKEKKTCYVYFATVYDVWVINIEGILKW